jgi:hypothetical protein
MKQLKIGDGVMHPEVEVDERGAKLAMSEEALQGMHFYPDPVQARELAEALLAFARSKEKPALRVVQ